MLILAFSPDDAVLAYFRWAFSVQQVDKKMIFRRIAVCEVSSQ